MASLCHDNKTCGYAALGNFCKCPVCGVIPQLHETCWRDPELGWTDLKQRGFTNTIGKFVKAVAGDEKDLNEAKKKAKKLDKILLNLLSTKSKNEYGHTGLIFSAFREALLVLRC